MELAASQAERARLVAAARTADIAQRALRGQLADAATAFRAAMSTAQTFLAQGAHAAHVRAQAHVHERVDGRTASYPPDRA